MTNLEVIRQMNLKELAFFLSVVRWDNLNSIHMIPKEDINYITDYLNKDGSNLIEAVQYCMNVWNDYNKEQNND